MAEHSPYLADHPSILLSSSLCLSSILLLLLSKNRLVVHASSLSDLCFQIRRCLSQNSSGSFFTPSSV